MILSKLDLQSIQTSMPATHGEHDIVQELPGQFMEVLEELSQQALPEELQGAKSEGAPTKNLQTQQLTGLPKDIKTMPQSEILSDLMKGQEKEDVKVKADIISHENAVQSKAESTHAKMAVGDDFLLQRMIFKGQGKNAGLTDYKENQNNFDFKMIKSDEKVDALQKNSIIDEIKAENNKQTQTSLTGVVTETPSLEGENLSNVIPLRDVLVTKTNTQLAPTIMADLTAENQAKVFEMNQMGKIPTVELIDKISQYIDQARFEKTQTLDLTVRHEQLGDFNIQANRGAKASELIELKIQAATQDGLKFFKANEAELVKSLAQNGVKLSDLRLVGVPENNNANQLSQHDGKNSSQQFDGQQRQGQQQQDDQGAQRRQQLWEEYRERFSA